MKTNPRIVLAALLFFAPWLASAQSNFVNNALAPDTYRPLDGPERWRRWWKEDGGSGSIHLDAFAMAGFTQALNDPSEWGRTATGFGRRLGGEYAGILVTNSIHEGFAAAEGTDPRYFPCTCTGLFRRSGHALEMTFLTYNRSGSKTLDLAQFSGIYGGAMVGTLWWPGHSGPLVHGVRVGDIHVGVIGTIHMVQEFSPELKRFFHVGGRAVAATPSIDEAPKPSTKLPTDSGLAGIAPLAGGRVDFSAKKNAADARMETFSPVQPSPHTTPR